MPRLIVLSNRVSMPSGQSSKSVAGGLAVALQEALANEGGIWMGWNGDVLPNDDTAINHFKSEQHDKVTYITTSFSKTQYEKYYCGYANNRLWAGLHDRTDLIASSSEDFVVYQAVNALFAKQLQQIAKPDDMIWVQDYHFFGVATHCRALGMTQRIGFFLHIPFPKLTVWQYLTYGSALIEQLVDYDVIGLQTEHDKQNCINVIEQVLNNNAENTVDIVEDGTRSIVTRQHHTSLVKAYPIGINPKHISELATRQLSGNILPAQIDQRLTTILAVERLDYTKGIAERLIAFGEFLQRYPQYIGQLQLYQIACPSRLDIQTYQQLQQQVHGLVKQMNDKFATPAWQPIVYQEEPVSHENLMPLFRRCDICWVNSLKDGMNLVAKEYVAAQDSQQAGVLLLSKNTGAAQQLQQAILVDPFDNNSMIAGLYQALNLGQPEKNQRHQQLLDNLYQQNIDHWRDAFLNDLTRTDNH